MKLTEEQLLIWRTLLALRIGDGAFLLPDEAIQHYTDTVQNIFDKEFDKKSDVKTRRELQERVAKIRARIKT